jgi:DNA repair protein RecO (recombination protein O)
MRSYKIEGVVIKRRNIGEADRILTVFSKNQGKISIKAVGVRRIKSRRSSHIELLNHSFLYVYKNRSLPILTEAESLESFQDIKNSLRKVALAYHICELVDNLCPENQVNNSLFPLLINTLKDLSYKNDVDYVIKEFEMNLLKDLGFLPGNFFKEINTHSFIEGILEKKLKSKQLFADLV